jgi:hypothetical protein
MQKNIWPNLRNILISRYGLRYEWHILGWLTTTQERHFFVHKLAMDKFLLTSHFYSSLLWFYPTQGHPIEVGGIHSCTNPTIWIKQRFKQGPHSTWIFIPLHAPIFTIRTSFYSSSTLNINPLQNLLLIRTYRLP